MVSLVDLAIEALGELAPSRWVQPSELDASVALCWGKAAFETARALSAKSAHSAKMLSLAIGPEAARAPNGWRFVRAEHPLPGVGSLYAGHALLEFFDQLRRNDVKQLNIYLSGGASSLAWIPRQGLELKKLRARLQSLYERPLSIAQLNEARARLCQLKCGGAARWLAFLAPQVRARVFLVSDVLPFGAEVVGSGPFWNGKIAHRVMADNSTWVRGIARAARSRGVNVLCAESGNFLGSWENWADRMEENVRRSLAAGRGDCLLIFGGEPQVDLRKRRGPGAIGTGGRQTQLAAALLLRLAPEIRKGQVEVVCLSSDGVDGTSGSGGAHLSQEVAVKAQKRMGALKKAVNKMNSAPELARLGGLVPGWQAWTNVQDVVLIKLGRF